MRLSGSNLELAQHCLYPFRPDIDVADTPGQAARLGTAWHYIAAETINHGGAIVGQFAMALRKAGLDASEENIDWLAKRRPWDAAQAVLGGRATARAEVAFVFDAETQLAKEIGIDLNREYGTLGRLQIPCTVDVLWLDGRCVAHVIDWKTGDPSNVTPCKDNLQMRFQAVCAAVAHDLQSVSARIAFVDDVGNVEFDTCTFDSFDLLDFQQRLSAWVHEVDMAIPMQGAHCTECYCPIIARCPRTLESRKALEDFQLPVQGPEHAARLLRHLKIVSRATSKIDDALRAYADAHDGFQTESGKVWKRFEVTRESISTADVAVAHDVFAKYGALRALKCGASKTDIEKEIGKQETHSLFASAREAGIVQASTCNRYEERSDK